MPPVNKNTYKKNTSKPYMGLVRENGGMLGGQICLTGGQIKGLGDIAPHFVC